MPRAQRSHPRAVQRLGVESRPGLPHHGVVARWLTGILGLLGLLVSTPATAGGLDLGAWVARPGVRLVVVEFYATWCEPCMKAVPQWKALHDKYRKDGLRLIVVATRDTDGSCTNPGWNPDDIICDDDGFLADRFGASSLPAAYLWSWQGDLLVKKGHVGAVHEKIASWMAAAPRVAVEVAKLGRGVGVRSGELADMVRRALRQDDKLVVVASAQERARLDALRKQSFKARYDQATQCELGKELSANGLVRAKVTGRRGRRFLHLQLLSAERGCLVASARVGWNRAKASVSVAEAVRELTQALQSKVQMPWASSGGQVSRAKDATESPYAKMAQELASADRKKKARDKELLRAWSVVSRFAGSPSISKDRRVAALQQFLNDFPRDNPREVQAQKMLASLQPPPKPKPKPKPKPQPEPRARAVSPAPRDRDGDGIPDRLDACPQEREDRDGFQDEDGCPDLDNDRDGVSDRKDKCPNAPETANGYEDEDGCPDKRPLVQKKERRLQVREPIAFEANKALIKRQSFATLNSIARVIKSNPTMHVRVEGHTDSRGSSVYNRRLSARRAHSVMTYLIAKGVSPDRLESKGYGEDKPLFDNATASGRSGNRRIEFLVLDK